MCVCVCPFLAQVPKEYTTTSGEYVYGGSRQDQLRDRAVNVISFSVQLSLFSQINPINKSKAKQQQQT